MTSIAVHTPSFFAVCKHPVGSCTGAGNVFKLPQEQMIKDILLMKYYRKLPYKVQCKILWREKILDMFIKHIKN